MAITSGTYRIKSNLQTGEKYVGGNTRYNTVPYFLNCYNTSSGSTVNAYLMDGSKDQIWRFDGNKLFLEKSSIGRVLSRSSTSSTVVQIGNSSLDNSLAKITFELISGKNYRIKIGEGSNTKYLTAIYNSNNYAESLNLEWKTLESGNAQSWYIEPLVKLTDYPNNDAKEYCATWSGLNSGYFTSAVKNSITNLCKACFNDNAGNNTIKYGNIYGALYSAGSPLNLQGKFHTGIDLAMAEGTNVYAPITGKVVKSADHYGTVTIKGDDGLIYIFLHMTDRIGLGSKVTGETTVIGKVGGIGANGVKQFDPHLHVEIHPVGSTRYDGDPYENSSETKSGVSLPVHNYF